MINFIITNWITIAIALLVLFYVGYLIYTAQWTKLRADAYKLMLVCQRAYAENEGEKKFKIVLQEIYKQLPFWLKLFVTEDDLKVKIQYWYNLMRDY